ncbi:MAG: hypothetical protein QM493_10385 [Sulfurovum sp.]
MDNQNSTLSYFSLDFSIPFAQAVKELKSKKGVRIFTGSQNYQVLEALWLGDTIDDYENKPKNYKGRDIHNIKTRIADLSNKYSIKIERQFVLDKNYKEYWIDRSVR